MVLRAWILIRQKRRTKVSDNTVSTSIDEVDLSKANGIIKWLLDIEDENDKTKKYGDSEMIQKIGKRIQDDVKCL